MWGCGSNACLTWRKTWIWSIVPLWRHIPVIPELERSRKKKLQATLATQRVCNQLHETLYQSWRGSLEWQTQPAKWLHWFSARQNDSFLKMCFYFACMRLCVCMGTTSMPGDLRGQALDHLKMKVLSLMSHQMNHIQMLWGAANALNLLSNPNKIIF